MASIAKRPNGKWRARYRDTTGREHSRHFTRKVDAQRWLDTVTASVVTGTYVDPAHQRLTVAQWCQRWLEGYSRRPTTIRQARVHIRRIEAGLGSMPLSSVRPSHVRAWVATMKAAGLSDSYVHATYRRLAQVMADAVHDGLLPRSPCSRRTSPGAGAQRPYVASTEAVWALHDALPAHLRPAVLLGAFAGLRTAEVAALRVVDVDSSSGFIRPQVQWPAQPLKSEVARTPIPVPLELAVALCADLAGEHVVSDPLGRPVPPWALERAVRAVRGSVDSLPEGFRFHDLRHYYASLLIASGLDVKVVQARMRHATATTTLNTYGHLWPDTDESARAAVGSILTARADSLRTEGWLAPR